MFSERTRENFSALVMSFSSFLHEQRDVSSIRVRVAGCPSTRCNSLFLVWYAFVHVSCYRVVCFALLLVKTQVWFDLPGRTCNTAGASQNPKRIDTADSWVEFLEFSSLGQKFAFKSTLIDLNLMLLVWKQIGFVVIMTQKVLRTTYSPNYFSIDYIMACHTLVPCRTEVNLPKFGKSCRF